MTTEDLESLTTKPHESIEESAGKKLEKLWDFPEAAEEVTYWLKPIGVTDSPITEQRTFGKSGTIFISQRLQEPRVFKGDILIEYGIGARRILSVYKATSNVFRVTKEDIKKNKRVRRWPWYVIGKNLTPAFGKNWHKHNLYSSELVNDYLKQNANGIITRAGSKTLNALMRQVQNQT